MRKVLMLILMAIVIVFRQSPLLGEAGGPPDDKLGTIERNVTYCRGGNENLLMDVYYPTRASGPVPAAMYVHGGGWHSGSKESGAGMTDLAAIRLRGYLAVSINYRLAPEYLFPAMIEDVKCAVRHLRANAQLYGLNPDRIGVWGGSAGGHLVALLGTTDETAGFEGTGGYEGVSSRVQAVVDMFGPTDLTLIYQGSGARIAGNPFGARSADDPVLALASPIHWVTRDDPPFLLLHGNLDPVVPVEQSKIFYDALQKAGVESELVIVQNAGHSFKPVAGPIDPTRSEITEIIADFFDKHLK